MNLIMTLFPGYDTPQRGFYHFLIDSRVAGDEQKSPIAGKRAQGGEW